MRLHKKVQLCNDCGMQYYKPIWEPLWLSKLAWKEFHSNWCKSPEHMDLVVAWREWERERIIKLLEQNKWRDEVVFNLAIALIKGENK